MAMRIMQFISIYFVLFFIISLIGYYTFPKKYQYVFILICNCVFYISWISDIRDIFILLTVIIATWVGGGVFFPRAM